MMTRLDLSVLLSSMLLAVSLQNSVNAAEDCSSYIDLLESHYHKGREKLLACGVPADNRFMQANLDEERQWCQQATQAERNQRVNEAGLPTLQCRGELHYFSIEFDAKSSQRNGLINALYENVTPEPVSKGILAAILANPSVKTGNNFTAFPVQDLEGASPTCRLYGVKTVLSTEPDRSHWLVTADAPCQRDESLESPLWVVEEERGKYRVLLAYRSIYLTVKTERNSGYTQLLTSHILDDRNDAYIVWQYDQSEGRYRYLSSKCSNISRIYDDEPLFIDGCYQGETW